MKKEKWKKKKKREREREQNINQSAHSFKSSFSNQSYVGRPILKTLFKFNPPPLSSPAPDTHAPWKFIWLSAITVGAWGSGGLGVRGWCFWSECFVENDGHYLHTLLSKWVFGGALSSLSLFFYYHKFWHDYFLSFSIFFFKFCWVHYETKSLLEFPTALKLMISEKEACTILLNISCNLLFG